MTAGVDDNGAIEALFQTFLDSVPDAMLICHPDGRIEYGNAQAERLFGYTRNQFSAMTVEQLLPARFRARHFEHRRRYADNPYPRNMGSGLTLLGLTRTGAEFPVEVSLSPIDHGGRRRIAAAVRDVSPRQRLEDALRASEQRFKDFATMAADWFWETDAEHTFTDISDRFEAVTGLPPATVLGRRRRDFLSPARYDAPALAAHDAALAGRQAFSDFDYYVTGDDGRERVVSTSGRPLFDARGRFLGYRGVARDITARRQSEQALRDAKSAAERADATKTRFLAAASHDLRQPLQALQLLNAALGRAVAGGDLTSAAAVCDRQRAVLSTMDSLLGALLDINRLEAGAITPNRRAFRVSDLLAQLRLTFTDPAAAKGLTLRVVPSTAVVDSDPDLLADIIGNLIGNAIKYTRRGAVLVGCRRGGARLRIEVRDSGPGIPDDRQRQIFDEFYRLDNAARDQQRGLGLGLSIVERLSRLLDHPIELRSAPGRGSTFAVTVPRGAEPVSDEPPPPASAARENQRPATVLYIDDDPTVLDAVSLLLQSEGWRVLAAGSGQQAAAQIAAGPRPDLIVSDYRLPGDETGIDVIERLRRTLGVSVPAALVTGEIGDSQQQQAQQHGLMILHKPVDGERLLTALQRLRQTAL